MTVAPLVTQWIELVGDDDPIDDRITRFTAKAKASSAAAAIRNKAYGLFTAAVVDPSTTGPALAALAPIVDEAVAEEDGEHTATERMDSYVVDLLDLANVVECTHQARAAATRATLRGWLPRIAVSRDDEDTASYWSVGYAALALGDHATVTRFAPARPFAAGATFDFNQQGLLAHLAAAASSRAKLADVMPAWHDLLASFGPLRKSNSADGGTLLWIARCVFHVIGGAPVETVTRRLHDELWTAAGLAP